VARDILNDTSGLLAGVAGNGVEFRTPHFAHPEMWQLNSTAGAASKIEERERPLVEFEAAALPHTQALLRTAKRLTRGDLSIAEDLVQETMLNAWRSFHQFERGTRCKSWLFRILLNLCSKRIQKLVSSPALVFLDAPCASEISQAETVSGHAEMLRALDSLSAEHRAVLTLQVVEGFTCGEVAKILGVPIGTVMSRLCRAKLALRAIVESPAMFSHTQVESEKLTKNQSSAVLRSGDSYV